MIRPYRCRGCAARSVSEPPRSWPRPWSRSRSGSAPAPARRTVAIAARRDADGDPQDPPRRDHHAGEPVVRLVLRHVPGRGRDPDEERRADGLRPRSVRASLRAAVPHLGRPQPRRPARPRRRDARHRRREDGRLHPARRTRAASSPASPRPGADCSLAPADAASVMGYHDDREIPNYWAWAKAFVLQDHMFESDTSWSLPSHLYLVSGWSAHCSKKGDPMSCRAGDPGAGLAARQPAEPDRDGSRLRLDRPHLPPAPPSRELGLLRLQRHPARLRRQRDVLQGREAEREDPRDLEPAARGSTPCARTASSATSSRSGTSSPQAKAGTLPAVSWVTPDPEGQRPPAGADLRTARPTSRA